MALEWGAPCHHRGFGILSELCTPASLFAVPIDPVSKDRARQLATRIIIGRQAFHYFRDLHNDNWLGSSLATAHARLVKGQVSSRGFPQHGLAIDGPLKG
jgi:hypothetical protein